MKAKHHLLGFDRCFVPAVVKNQQTYIRGYVLDDEACSKMIMTVKLASVILTDIICTLFVGLLTDKTVNRFAHCRFSLKTNKQIWFFCREEYIVDEDPLGQLTSFIVSSINFKLVKK